MSPSNSDSSGTSYATERGISKRISGNFRQGTGNFGRHARWVKIPEAAIARLALRPRHFINYNVVVNSTIEFDQRRNGTRLHHRFASVGSCKSANSVHGLPSCEDEKFNLVAKVPPTQMCPDKPWNFAQLGHNFFAKVPWIRIRIRWTRACTPLAGQTERLDLDFLPYVLFDVGFAIEPGIQCRAAREIREDRGTDHFTGVVENSPGGAQFTSLDHWLDPLEMCASGGFAPGWCVGIGAVVSQQKEM